MTHPLVAALEEKFQSVRDLNLPLGVPEYQGGQALILPISAIFVVDEAGVICTRHVDPDYRRRMELNADLKGARGLVCLPAGPVR